MCRRCFLLGKVSFSLISSLHPVSSVFIFFVKFSLLFLFVLSLETFPFLSLENVMFHFPDAWGLLYEHFLLSVLMNHLVLKCLKIMEI